MKDADLSVDLAGLKLINPTMLASGILGFSAETLLSVEKGGAGAVVTKSVCLRPRSGYPNPTIVQANCGLINAMGLPNAGIEAFAEEIREAKASLKIPVVVSVFGFSVDEYSKVSRRAVVAGADAVELNVSCPHVKDTGCEIGQDPKLLSRVIRKVKASVNKPVIVKLSPNDADIVEIALASEKAGADALTIMNTVKAMAINVETGVPVLSNAVGGLSGSAVKPFALRNVFEVYREVHVPIVGCGGVTDWRDAVEFFLAGASAVQIGTAVATVGTRVFSQVVRGISGYLGKRNLGSVREIVGVAHKC